MRHFFLVTLTAQTCLDLPFSKDVSHEMVCSETSRATLSSRFRIAVVVAAVLILRSLGQPSRHFGRVGSLSLWRGAQCEIFCRDPGDSHRHFVQIALQRDLAQQLLHRTCQGDLAHDLLQSSSQRDLAESNLVSQSLFFMFLPTLFGDVWGLLPA